MCIAKVVKDQGPSVSPRAWESTGAIEAVESGYAALVTFIGVVGYYVGVRLGYGVSSHIK